MSRLFIPPFSNKMSRCPDMNNLCGPSRHIYICCTFLWFLVMFGDFWWDLLLVAIMCWLIGVHFISDHIRVTLDIHTTWHSNEQKVVHIPPHQCSVDNVSLYLKDKTDICWAVLSKRHCTYCKTFKWTKSCSPTTTAMQCGQCIIPKLLISVRPCILKKRLVQLYCKWRY